MKRTFITGIEGFVGHYLADLLASKNHETSGIYFDETAIKGLKGKPYRCDIRDVDKVKMVLAEIKPDWIFHLAAISSVAISYNQPSLTFDINVQGIWNLLAALNELHLNPRVILISSCEVYGRALAFPIKETAPLCPLSPYALSKVFSEEVGQFYHRTRGADVVILRPFTHTGPGHSEVFVFPGIARRIAEIERGEREPVLEVGNIENERDFTDVRDMVRAYLLAAEHCPAGESYNITSGKTISIKAGIEFLLSQAKKKIELKVDPNRLRPNDIQTLKGDGGKFSTLTGWKPEIEFKQTLKELLDFYRQRS
jgi:GDP-4-dehydro-6-deoxy-D-mannose reductase